jgi:hypothetical protein
VIPRFFSAENVTSIMFAFLRNEIPNLGLPSLFSL